MQWIRYFLCNQLMGFDTHHDVGRFDTDNQIVISLLLNHMYLVNRTLHNTFCRHTMVFFHQFFFQRTAVDTDTDWNIAFFCHVHYSFNLIGTADIARIDTDFIRTVFHCRNRHAVIKMNIRNQWNMNIFFNFRNRLCRFNGRHGTADNFTARCLQFQYLSDRCFYIFRMGIGHGLNQHRISAADFFIADCYCFRMFSKHLTLLFLQTFYCRI